jgi:hypothetical protein
VSDRTEARIDDLVSRLEIISDEIGDLSIEAVRAALGRGETKRPDDDKRYGRARHGVDKAIRELRGSAF